MLQIGQKSKTTIKLTNLGLTTPIIGIWLFLFSVPSATAVLLFILHQGGYCRDRDRCVTNMPLALQRRNHCT